MPRTFRRPPLNCGTALNRLRRVPSSLNFPLKFWFSPPRAHPPKFGAFWGASAHTACVNLRFLAHLSPQGQRSLLGWAYCLVLSVGRYLRARDLRSLRVRCALPPNLTGSSASGRTKTLDLYWVSFYPSKGSGPLLVSSQAS